jgi:hypothetical protein
LRPGGQAANEKPRRLRAGWGLVEQPEEQLAAPQGRIGAATPT